MSEKNRSFLGRTFGFIWRAIVTLYRAVVILGVILSLVMIWALVRGGPSPTVEDNVALVLWPSGELVEADDEDPSQRFVQRLSGNPPARTPLRDLIDALDVAADDKRISLAVLKLDDMTSAGMPQLDELGAAMRRFQAAGKPIYAYAPAYDQTAYYAAAGADEVTIDPYGILMLEGLSSYNNYYKDALDELGVKIHVFRVGEYKSAVEPFTRNDMSEDAKIANAAWLGDLWQLYGQKVAEGRHVAPDAANSYVSGFADALAAGGGDAAQLAKNAGLVNNVETLQQFRGRIAQVVGNDEAHGSFRQIRHDEYLRAVDGERARTGGANPDAKIGLVVVQGEIVDGTGVAGQAGGDTVYGLLDEARRDDDVKAVVLRVDSPGGSVWAAEQIRRGVLALRAEGKPVIASMSSVAASGGYWVSMDADEIWAHPSTITGSIGIFGLIPTIETPLAKLGIHTDGVGTTPLAGALRIDRPLSPAVQTIIQSQIDRGYRNFIEGVANGRGMTADAVDEIARGRVWSGAKAKEIGLIDEFGGLEEAAAAAARRAQLGDGEWSLEPIAAEYHFPFQMFSPFFSQMGSGFSMLPKGVLARVQDWLQRSTVARQLSALNDPQGIYAYCFCEPVLSSPR